MANFMDPIQMFNILPEAIGPEIRGIHEQFQPIQVEDDDNNSDVELLDLSIIKHLKYSLTKTALYELFEVTHDLMPKPNNLPENKICENCYHYLGDFSANLTRPCPNCNSEHVNAIFAEYDLKSLLKEAFEIRNLYHYIDLHKKNQNTNPDFICDITDGSKYQNLVIEGVIQDGDVVLMWNTDGFPISNSSNGQVWPIQVEVLNVPFEVRRRFQFVTGIYYSLERKPNMASFLKPIVECFKDLFDVGIEWNDKSTNTLQKSKVIAPIATLDAPAEHPFNI
ncbi:hypothetical protein TKK_0018698 [Trichogramma kaykai]